MFAHIFIKCYIKMMKRLKIYINGIIQGVGMRPFVYNLANSLNLKGFVQNTIDGLNIEVEGEEENLKIFIERLKKEKPAISYIFRFEYWEVEIKGYNSFEIIKSKEKGDIQTYILPDLATCKFCLEDIFDEKNRRYRYPFTNCTLCGPRFSIIQKLPYDRKNTTMKEFKMCKKCQEEYDNPSDRRFHAQPNACPECGPRLFFYSKTGELIFEGEEALQETENLIKKGKIVGIKGLGGFHIVCDAKNDKAVALLRERKGRQEKPFALMYPSVEKIKEDCFLSEKEEEILKSPQAPIILIKSKKDFCISPLVAPHNKYLGVMLPYTPLHHILLKDLNFPIVATSGNLSEEPIIKDEKIALKRLKDLCDSFLVHNRKIERHIDDSIVRVMGGKEVVLRRARGYVPFPFITEKKNNSVGFGGFLKANLSFQKGKNIFVSQHIGDLETESSFEVYKKIFKDFRDLFKIKLKIGSHDLHPDFPSTNFANSQKLKLLPLQHHISHLFSCMEDNGIKPPFLGAIWDGTGLGEDKNIWGGEFFILDENFKIKRFAHFLPFHLIGGEAAIKEPKRIALSLLYSVLGDGVFKYMDLPPLRSFKEEELNLLLNMLKKNINCPLTTSAGRLFDGISSLSGIRHKISYEGQAAMELEFSIREKKDEKSYEFFFKREENGGSVYVISWENIILSIIQDIINKKPIGIISYKFHLTMAEIIKEIAKISKMEKVVLSGGCFQNLFLLEKAKEILEGEGFFVYFNQRIPPNDGGISFGQVVALNYL